MKCELVFHGITKRLQQNPNIVKVLIHMGTRTKNM